MSRRLEELMHFAFFDDALWVRPPLYVLLLAGLFRVFGQGEAGIVAAWLLQVGLGVATVGHARAGLSTRSG